MARMWSCKFQLWMRNEPWATRLTQGGGANVVPEMMKDSPHYEAAAWFFTMLKIGQALRGQYEPQGQLPSEFLTLVEQIDKKLGASDGPGEAAGKAGRRVILRARD